MKFKNATILLGLALLTFIIGLGVSSLAFAQGGSTVKIYLPLMIKQYPIFETGKVVFVSTRDGKYGEIYKMNYDGSDVTRLTNNSSEDMSPDWSPDGTKIAFKSNRTGEYEIYVMNADGTGQIQVTTMTNCDSPQWSPDGKRIAFYTRQNNNNIIYTMNPDGTELTPVTDPAMSADSPYWSPDGLKIAFLSSRTVPGLYTINLDGTDQQLLIDSGDIAYMAWSPDGASFVLSKITAPNFNMDVFIYDIATKTTTRITTTQSNHNSVDWSPDGNYVIFHSNRDDISNFELYAMTSMGEQIINISHNPNWDSDPDWVK